jgi:hypothetical protein
MTFESKKGLRQGDPLSSILFDIVVDILTLTINKVVDHGLLKGVLGDLVEGGVSLLQC